MNKDSVASKAELRRVMAQAVRSMPDDEYREGSVRLCGLVRQMESWRQSAAVCLYYPLQQEPDIRPLFRSTLDAGKRLYLPRYREASGMYEPVPVLDPERDLQPGRYGIPEPRVPEVIETSEVVFEFILVPGVAFSVNGCRLGRGGGYFDRLLARRNAERCGVAFECQLMTELPMEPHDIRMDYIVTPARCVKCIP